MFQQELRCRNGSSLHRVVSRGRSWPWCRGWPTRDRERGHDRGRHGRGHGCGGHGCGGSHTSTMPASCTAEAEPSMTMGSAWGAHHNHVLPMGGQHAVLNKERHSGARGRAAWVQACLLARSGNSWPAMPCPEAALSPTSHHMGTKEQFKDANSLRARPGLRCPLPGLRCPLPGLRCPGLRCPL